MPAASFLPALTLYRQDAVQGSGGDPQPLRDGNIVLHALIHGITADHQHMGTTEVVTRHVDAVLMLLGDAVRQEQRQEQQRADRRETGLIDRPAILGGGFGVLKLVIAPGGGDVSEGSFHNHQILSPVSGQQKAAHHGPL